MPEAAFASREEGLGVDQLAGGAVVQGSASAWDSSLPALSGGESRKVCGGEKVSNAILCRRAAAGLHTSVWTVLGRGLLRLAGIG